MANSKICHVEHVEGRRVISRGAQAWPASSVTEVRLCYGSRVVDGRFKHRHITFEHLNCLEDLLTTLSYQCDVATEAAGAHVGHLFVQSIYHVEHGLPLLSQLLHPIPVNIIYGINCYRIRV